MNSQVKTRRAEAGFTLVELAIVMIIIGLLIGGVLKGQELIANAQVTATVAQIKGIDAATTTFRDMYDAMPGDIINPARLPNCGAAPCNVAGNGNNQVNGGFGAVPAGEARSFFSHLSAANLLTGIIPNNAAAGDAWGANYPAAKLSGGFHVSFYGGGAGLTNYIGASGAGIRAGHYLALHNNPAAGVNAVGFLIPNQAYRIDSKLDDGNPDTGAVLAAGGAACRVAGPPIAYNDASGLGNCNLYIRFQN